MSRLHLLGTGNSVSSVTTSIWNRASMLRLVMGLEDTLLPALGASKQPVARTCSPVRDMPAFVIAVTGSILQETFRLLQVGPTAHAVPTVPMVALACCNRLHFQCVMIP